MIGILTFHRGPNHGGYLQAAELVAAVRRAGHDVEIINYQNADAQLHALYDLIKKNQDQIQVEGLDLSKLPPFSFFQKYLPVTGGYTIPDDQGFFSSNYSKKRAN